MATATLPDDKPKEDHNPGKDEFDKLIERNFSPGDERTMEERAKDGAIDDNVDSGGFSNKDDSEEISKASEDKSSSDEQEKITEHENQLGRGYKPNAKGIKLDKQDKKDSRRWMFNKRQKLLGGGVAGTLIAIFGFFIFQGPLQFVHIAQLLEQFHFSAQEDQADDRFTKLARYIKYRSSGEVEKTRLGYFQNKLADRVETKMNKTGIQSSYTQIFGFGDGYIIDPEKLSASEFEDLKGKTPTEIEKYFKENFSVDLKTKLPNGEAVPKGTFFLDSSNLGYFENSKLNKTMLKAAKYSKVSSSVGSRVMGKRAGVNWHPMKKLDNKILKTAEARYLEWKKNRIADVQNGTQVGIEGKSTPTDEKDPATKQGADSAAAEGNAAIADGQDVGNKVGAGDTGAISGFQDRLSVKVGVGGASAAGILCMAKGIDENADQIKMKQVVLPLIRIGMMAISLGNQVMTGGQDVSTEQLGFFSRQLNGKDSSGNKTSWVQAQSIQAELGNKPNGNVGKPDETLTTITNNSPFHFLNTGTFGSILGPVCSTPGQLAITVVSFIGGPVSALTQTVVAEIAAGPIMNTIAHWLSGNAVDPMPVGADFGNEINFGAVLASNAQGVSRGGRQLSKEEGLQIAAAQHDKSEQEFQDHGLAYKLLNPYDVRSAISKVIDQQSTGLSQNISNTATSLLHFNNLFASLPKLLTPKAQAYSPTYYDYGVPRVGFSKDEINNAEVKNPYKNADDVVKIILPAHSSDYIERAKKCFGVTIDPTTFDVTDFHAGNPEYKDITDDKCNDKNINWVKVRFYIFDTQNIESIACYEGEDDACAAVGFNSATASTTTPDPTTTTAVSGDLQELAKQILANSNITYPLDAISTNGSTKAVLQALAKGDKAPVTCATAGVTSADLSPGILKFLAELGSQGRVGVNAITDKCHSGGSPHYKGKAIDFECQGVPFNTAKADPIASKYGGKRNFETCSGNSHWHYDFE